MKFGFHYLKTRNAALIVLLGFIFPAIAMFPVDEVEDGLVNKVVIDAGHGGNDPGNMGTRRYRKYEKDVALATTLLVGRYIRENLPDVEVVYTRTDDSFVELRQRTAIANRANADLFISIHCNASTSRSPYGSETYVMGLDREAANLEVSRRENSVIYLEENYEEHYRGFDPDNPVTTIAARLMQSAYLDQSIDFASRVQDEFRERVKRKDRGVKQSVLWVLDYSAMPSVLVELGFLTHSSEEDFLHTTRGQELMASGIYRAFKAYKYNRETRLKYVVQPTQSAIDEHLVADDSLKNDSTTPVVVPSRSVPVYKVQIAVSSTLRELTPENFGGLKGVNYFVEGSLYKYTYGTFSSRVDAESARAESREAGFEDAYIIAFLGDEKISLEEARRLLQ